MSAEEMRRGLKRIAHEILERNGGMDNLILIGIHTRGTPLARRLATYLSELEGMEAQTGALDIGLYRDDAPGGLRPTMLPTDIPVSIQGQRVILVDDVLFTGRTVRAAMDALTDFGRPDEIQLVALIDRGHRELPIRADYVGKNIPTSLNEKVEVKMLEIDGTDEIVLLRGKES